MSVWVIAIAYCYLAATGLAPAGPVCIYAVTAALPEAARKRDGLIVEQEIHLPV